MILRHAGRGRVMGKVRGRTGMKSLRWALAASLVLLTAVSGWAQGTTGKIAGQITDDQGLAVPGVTVSAQNASNGFSRSATSDAAGAFQVAGLPAGTYSVKAEL